MSLVEDVVTVNEALLHDAVPLVQFHWELNSKILNSALLALLVLIALDSNSSHAKKGITA